jgi:hypothetical protein
MSDNTFQFFEGSNTESTDVARITVRRGGILVLTQKAVELLGEGVTHVKIGFDAKSRAIGLKSTEPGARGCYRLRQQGKSLSRLVDGKRVFAHHGLQADKAHSFDAQEFGGGVVGFAFPEPAAAAEAPVRAKTAKK